MVQNRLHAMRYLDLSPLRLDSIAHSDQLLIGVAHARWLHKNAGHRFHTVINTRRRCKIKGCHRSPPRTIAELTRVTHVSQEYEFVGDFGDDNNDSKWQ